MATSRRTSRRTSASPAEDPGGIQAISTVPGARIRINYCLPCTSFVAPTWAPHLLPAVLSSSGNKVQSWHGSCLAPGCQDGRMNNSLSLLWR